MQNRTIIFRTGISSSGGLGLRVLDSRGLGWLGGGLPPAFCYPDIILDLSIVYSHIPHGNAIPLRLIDDAFFDGHGPGTAFVNAGILKPAIVENGDGREHG
jgi:hypothetical protein